MYCSEDTFIVFNSLVYVYIGLDAWYMYDFYIGLDGMYMLYVYYNVYIGLDGMYSNCLHRTYRPCTVTCNVQVLYID